MSKRIAKRILLSAGIVLSLLFAFNVKTHVIYATTTDDDVTVEDDDDDVTTTDDDEDDDDEEANNNNDEEETTTQAEEGEAIANGVKITNANNDNEKNTVNYVVAAEMTKWKRMHPLKPKLSLSIPVQSKVNR